MKIFKRYAITKLIEKYTVHKVTNTVCFVRLSVIVSDHPTLKS